MLHQQTDALMQEGTGWSETWVQRLAYQYDGYGNWTERITETILDTGECRLSMIERREQTFY